jgi:peptidoglycan/LPS O-acetylase OafA/YrhL
MININIQIFRSFSVLFVLFFHLGVETFKFGYIGVDIFFVISGFLIPIIKDKYTPLGFIKARTKRLIPALSYLLLFCLIIGYFIQLPGELINIASSSILALAFQSHIYFLFNTGYFDIASIYQPLLHTWSLGNEYWAYLVVFILMLSFNKKFQVASSLIIAIICGVYVVLLVNVSELNYLDPISRLYLFFISFYVSCYRDKLTTISDGKLLLTSVVLITFIIYFYYGDIYEHIWPNLSMLLLPFSIIPFFLIEKSIIPVQFIENLMVKLGNWSYSIYLWHWPLIAFERTYFRNDFINNKEVVLLAVLSIFMGAFSFKYLEKYNSFTKYWIAICILFSSFIILSNGAEYRIPQIYQKYGNTNMMINTDQYIKKENFDIFKLQTVRLVKNNLNTLVIGDSHSQHILPFYLKSTSRGVYRIATSPSELALNMRVINKLIDEKRVSRLVISFYFNVKEKVEIKKLIDKINNELSNKVELIVVRDIPAFDGDPVACLLSNNSLLMYKNCGFNIEKGIPKRELKNNDSDIWRLFENLNFQGAILLNTHENLCDSNLCTTTINGDFIYRDDNHFNEMLSDETNASISKVIFRGIEE